MVQQEAYTWIISSQELSLNAGSLQSATVFKRGISDDGQHLTLLRGRGAASDFVEGGSQVQSCLDYNEINGGKGQDSANEARLLVVVGLTPPRELEEDMNKWYDEEHVEMLSRVPGWLQSIRLKAADASQDSPQYLALHLYKSDEAVGATKSAEFKAAVTTPWRTRIIDACQTNGRNGFARWQWRL